MKRSALIPATLAVVVLLLSLILVGGSRAAPTAQVTFQGRVIEGLTGTEPPNGAKYIEGATISLWCGGNPAPAQGSFVVSTTTNIDGYYGLTIEESSLGCEVFHIIETDPLGRASNGSATVGGTVISDNWIQFDVGEAPLAEQDLTGNKFWDTPVGNEATCDSCESCSTALSGVVPTVKLIQDIVTSVDGPCVQVGAADVTFDGQGHAIRNTATGTESDVAVNVVAHTNVTVTGLTLDDWGVGINLFQASDAHVLTNTVTAGGIGLRLMEIDHAVIAGNTITGSVTGVWMGSSDNNGLTQNVLCKQAKRDIEMSGTNSGNTRLTNTCDAIYNWNGDSGLSSCMQTCTPSTATTAASAADLSAKLNGDYGTVTLTNNVPAPDGISITGNHVTLDCDNNEIIGSGTGAGLVFEDKVGVKVADCNVHGFQTGIELRSSGQSTLSRNNVYSNTTGIALVQSDPVVMPIQNILYDNELTDNSLYGISLVNARNNSLQLNDFTGSGHYDLWVEDECTNYVDGSGGIDYTADITGTTVTGSGSGEIILCNVHDSTVQNMTVDNQSDQNNGILIVDSGDTTVRDITIRNSRGVLIRGSNGVTVTGSIVTNSAADGIAYESSPNGTIFDNDVRTSAGYGIAVRSLSGSTGVISNAVGAGTLPNVTSGGNADGILVSESDNVTVRDNWVRRNTGEGIAIEDAANVTVQANTVRGNQYGLYMDNAVSGVVVNDNGICYSTGTDIYSNAGTDATGDNNTCSSLYAWQDSGEAGRCTNECVGWYNMDWGFSFHNPVVDNLSWSRYEDTFGEDEVEFTVKICAGLPICIPFKCWCAGKMIDIGTGVPEPVALALYYAAYRNLGEPGTCYGMSAKSLDFYNYNDHPSNYLPGATMVADLLANSSYGSSDLRVNREFVHGSQMSTEALAVFLSDMATGADSANTVLANARSGLASGQMGAVSIKNGLTSGHVMNYDSVVDEAGDISRIYVYDSNNEQFVTGFYDDPTQFPDIVVDRAANDWSYQRSDGTWGNDSIFDVPYSVLNRSDWTLPGSVNGILNIVFGSGAKATVEDMPGNLLGYDAAGTPHEAIPGGMGYPVWGATETDALPARLLVQPGDYDVHIVGGSGPYTATLAGLRGAYALENIPATPGTRDELAFRIVDGNALHNELAMMTGDGTKPVNATWTRGADPSGDRRIYRIAGDLDSRGKIWIKTLPDLSGAVIANRGGASFTYMLSIQNEMIREGVFLPAGAPTRIVGPFTVDPGGTDAVVPADWGNLMGSGVDVTTSVCGDGALGLGEDTVNCPQDAGPPLSCVVPYDDMVIASDTRLCSGIYNLPDAGQPGVVTVTADGVTLDCNGATLSGSGSGIGIHTIGTQDVAVRGCAVQGYTHGIVLDGVQGGTISQSVLTGNEEWGLHAIESTDLSAAQLYVADNGNGLLLNTVAGATLDQVTVCPNTGLDIAAWGSHALSGTDNACDNADGWHDTGVDACTYACTGGVTVTHGVYLPLLAREDD